MAFAYAEDNVRFAQAEQLCVTFRWLDKLWRDPKRLEALQKNGSNDKDSVEIDRLVRLYPDNVPLTRKLFQLDEHHTEEKIPNVAVAQDNQQTPLYEQLKEELYKCAELLHTEILVEVQICIAEIQMAEVDELREILVSPQDD